MRNVYLGTSEFAAVVLRALAASAHRPQLVVTRPDARRGRGLKLAPPPVATLARELGIDIIQPEDLHAPEVLERIAAGLERLAPPVPTHPDLDAADAFIWQMQGSQLVPVPRVNRVEMELLHGIERMRDTLLENTERFAGGLPANNALLWGARGMGKSSLVKAVHADINTNRKPVDRLKLIEIHREDIESLPGLMDLLRSSDFRFIVFCDDLSFDGNDASYKSLKAVLDGGIEGRPDNIILHAPSNRRHLLAR